MEAGSRDAESLSLLAEKVKQEADSTVVFSKSISDIDDNFTKISIDIMKTLKDSDYSYGNQTLLSIIEHAKKAHMSWYDELRNMVDTGILAPLQTNSKKCSFGHSYHALDITHPEIKELWQDLSPLHDKFHLSGDKVINEIKNKNLSTARNLLKESKNISEEMLGFLTEISNKIAQLSQKGQKAI